MEEIISKPWWEFIGVVTGVILSVIAIYISIKQNRLKQLSYHIPYLYPLVDISKNEKNDFEIKYKGERIDQVCICEVCIENIGEIPVKKEDFEEPIKIEIENCTHIFDVKIIDKNPKHLIVGLDVKSNSNIILINALLLNPKDLIRLKVVFEGDNSKLKITSRIVGLQKMVNKNDTTQYKNKIYGILTILCGFAIYYFSPVPLINGIGPFIIGAGINLVLEPFFQRLTNKIRIVRKQHRY